MSNDTVFITEATGKTVLDSEGKRIGKVADIKSDSRGSLTTVFVRENVSDPTEETQRPYLDYPKENGFYKIPVDSVQAVKDHILVE